MNDEKIYEILKQTGALLTGHFKLSSGFHSDKYVQCAKLLQYPELAEQTGIELAKRYKNAVDILPDVIASPALGGIVIGQEVAKSLGKIHKSDIRHIFIEKGKDGNPLLRRGFSIEKGEKFAVVEDVITTGKSTLEVINLLKRLGGEPVAILSIINRTYTSEIKIHNLDIPFISLIKLALKIYEPENCPLCKRNIPIEKPGSRHS